MRAGVPVLGQTLGRTLGRTLGQTLGRVLVTAGPLLAVAACETGPHERRVRAEFACEDARRLRVTYFQDRGTAELRLSRKEVAEIPAIAGVPGRAFAGSGWEMRGLGDSVTLTSPGAPPTRCTETR